MKVQLAFYKGSGDWTDKAIRLWTRSKYSHVELVVDDMWYSTSPRDMKVRKKLIVPKEGNWDFVEVNADITAVYKLFFVTEGKEYDWKGILLSQLFPFNKHDKNKWFCSEWCAEALGYENSNRFSPGKLYKEVTK
jgi:hypothetical protein